MEVIERRNSYFKKWLYFNDAKHELKIATVAISPDKEPDVNRYKIVKFVTDIKNTHSNIDLIVFGEVILGWYNVESQTYHKEIAETIPGSTTELISKLAKENNVFITFGMAEGDNGKIYNSQILINNSGEIIDIQRKKNLRSNFFEPEQESISIVDLNGISTGIVICYDIRSKESIKMARDNNVDLIILSNADYIDEWDDKYFGYKYIVKQYNSWIVTSNRFGVENETSWDGHIEIFNPFSDLMISGKLKEQYIVYNLTFNTGHSKNKEIIRKIYSNVSLAYLVIKNLKIALSYL